MNACDSVLLPEHFGATVYITCNVDMLRDSFTFELKIQKYRTGLYWSVIIFRMAGFRGPRGERQQLHMYMTVVEKALGRPRMKLEENIKMDLKYNYKNRRLMRVYEGRVQRRT
jgi:hypothetical protein